jgi:hypothetical protein
VERGRKLGERKLAMDAGQVELATSEMKDGRKTKLARSSSGSRQLPDPSQISGKSRSLPRTEGSENVDGALCNGVEIPGNSSRPKNDPQDPVDASEHARSSAQAPPIKAPLIASLALSRNGSNATETSRKRNQLSKRSSPVLSRKSPDLVRKSMDDQLLEPRTSPPLRRAKSEADTPLENLRHKSRHSRNSDATKNSEHSRNADGKCATNTAVHSNEGTMSRNSEHSRNSDGNHSKNSENSRYGDKTRPRSRKTLTDHDSTRRSSAGDDIVSKKLMNLSQDGNISNSTNSLAQEDTGSNGTNAGDKPRRQMKKYRGREHRKPTEVDGKVSSVDGSQHLEPLMLEST